MNSKTFLSVILLAITSVFIACGNSSNDDKTSDASEQQKRRLNWDSVPSEFNPQTFEENFQTTNINRIFIDMFGFKDDVEVVYTDSLATGQGYLKIYSVLKDSGSRGSFDSSATGQKLQLNRYGSYQCSIKIENGSIAQLKGLCFVRLQIYLPTGSEIEVYNLKQLISRRFIPIDSDTFIDSIKAASFSNEKKSVIDDFISSYNGMNKSPQLTAAQLGIVVSNFNLSDEKFDVLRKLHGYIVDRQNLAAMIESKINYFDRDEARRICGL
jgi:hypothetical protein